MKQILLFSLALCLSTFLNAQCDAPEVLDWTAVNDSTFNITFESSVTGEYQLALNLDYADDVDVDEVLTTSGIATTGVNVITVSVSQSLLTPWTPLATIYFTAYLSIECTAGTVSDSTKFYLSAHSLVGESGFTCDSLYQPFEPLPDGSGAVYEIAFTVPDNGDVVESLSAFVDLGHTFNGDLSIFLTHPNGTEVTLLDIGQAFLSSSWGFSVIFTDEASEEIPDVESNGPGPRGIFLPYEALSILIGEPMAGEWTLTIVDNLSLDDGMVFGICLTLNGIPCISSVEGKAFYDFDENGVQNDLEQGFPYALIENSISDDQFYAGADGDFWNCSEEGAGTLEVQNVPEYYEAATVDISLAENDQLQGVLIPITAAELISDVAVDLISLEPNRPGFEANYLAQISNVGTICEDDISVEITFPDYVEIVGSANPDLIITDNTASIEVDQVCPFSPFEVNLTILLDDTVSLGTMLDATILANVPPNDPNALNNSFTSTVEVVGSYDPNDKQVSATTIGDEFLEDESPLKYTIRFQNTGTFYAERVVIADTIDSDLDLNSLQIISTSHDMQLVREGNVLYFEFDQIFLPDSATDFDGSIGHVRYEMNPLPSFSEGEVIENTAYIYFDFNEPIITNTVVTEFGNPLSISNEIDFETRLFPNPANQNITVSWAQDVEVDRIEIYDLSGRLIKSEAISVGNNYTLSVNELPEGLYLLNLQAGELQSRQKFVKMAER
ncbi:MAG TPA: T9SS type A sorting domain-containing protein [Cryomorphaceae bacterium]|nr:T9SS type A sorting domain-containing protein [Cryomorphaceae bacterium]